MGNRLQLYQLAGIQVPVADKVDPEAMAALVVVARHPLAPIQDPQDLVPRTMVLEVLDRRLGAAMEAV